MHFHKIVVALLMVVAVVLAQDEEQEHYSDKYDYVDATEILENERLREQYYKCFMDLAPCITPDAKFFKGNFAEVLVTKCKKCTEKQKENFDKMAEWYTTNQPDRWHAFVEKYVKQASESKN